MYLPISLLLVASARVVDGNVGFSSGSATPQQWGGGGPPPQLEEPPLPPGWSEHTDPSSGQSYFYNSNDGTTTWDRPGPLNPPEEEDKPAGGESSPSPEGETDQPQIQEPAANQPLESQDQAPPSSETEAQVESALPATPNPLGSSAGDGSPPHAASTDGSPVAADAHPDAAGEEHDRKEDQWRDNRSWDTPPQGGDPRSGPWGVANPEVGQQRPGWNPSGGQATPMPEQQPDRPTESQRPPNFIDNRRSGEQLPLPQEGRPSWGQRPQPDAQPPGRRAFVGSNQHQPAPPQGSTRSADGNFPPPRDGAPRIPQTQARPPTQQEQRPQLPNSSQGRPPMDATRPPVIPNKIPESQPQNHQRPPMSAQQQAPPQYRQQPPPQYGRYPQGNYPPQYGQQSPPQDPRYSQGNQYNGYGNNNYGQPPQHLGEGGQLTTQEQNQPGLRDSIGKTWQNLLGFGNRTKEALATARDTVTSEANEAVKSAATASSGIFGQAKNALSSVFGSEEKSEGYSLSQSYNLPPQQGGPGARQPPGYSQQQQQQPPPGYYPNQGYPPQNPGRPWPPQGGPGQYPPQGQRPPQNQQQQQTPPGRYPPGFRPPQPRTDAPGPHQQQQPFRQQPPPNAQWGNGTPPGYGAGRSPPGGPPPHQQQQYPGRGPPPPASEDTRRESEPEKQQQPDPWQHPGLNEGF